MIADLLELLFLVNPRQCESQAEPCGSVVAKSLVHSSIGPAESEHRNLPSPGQLTVYTEVIHVDVKPASVPIADSSSKAKVPSGSQ